MKPRFFQTRLFASSLGAAAITLTLSAPLSAAIVSWDGGPAGTGTDFGTPANWAGDVLPSVTVPDTAEFNGTAAGPLALVYSNAAFAGGVGNAGINLNVTATQTAAVNLDAGTANTASLRMGNLTIAAGAGAFSLGNGANNFNLTLGGGPGTHVWTNDSANPATISSEIIWGLGGAGAHTLVVGGAGSWNFNNAAGQGNGVLTVTKSGAGTMHVNGASTYTGGLNVENGTVHLTAAHTGTGVVSVGTILSQNGILHVDGGTLNANSTASPGLAAGTTSGSNGFIQLTSGAINTVSQLHLGRGAGGYAAMNVSGGTATVGNWFVVGYNGDRAVLNQSGGSIVVSANRMTLGAGGGESIGVANLSGGTFQDNAGIYVGENGTGTLNVSGTAAATLGNLQFAGAATSLSGRVNLLGGTLSVASITKGTSSATGTYAFNFNGGVLKPTASNANFFNDLADTTAVVRAGGARIDTNGFDIAISEPLIAPAGNGIATPAITNGGAGYIDTPVVIITRGATDTTGVGASATATVANGVVTAITITNPGSGYTDVPIFTLAGGGATTPATVTGSAPVANTSGGLTKSGAGTLTLGGAGTYTGPTLVSAGTLAVAPGGSINPNSGLTVNGATARLVQNGIDALTPPVTVTQGSVNGTGIINSLTFANLAANTLESGNGAFGSLTINNLVFQGAATINTRVSGYNVEQFFYADNLTTNAAGKVTINAANTTGVWQPGDYPILYYTGSFTGSASHFAVGNVPGLTNHQSASIVAQGGVVALRIEGDSLTWTGSANGNWSTTAVGGAHNWWYPSSSELAEFSNGSGVLFNDQATRYNVNLASNVAPGSTVFENFDKDYTLSSTGGFGITSGSLLKNGTAKVTLLTNNTFTGSTIINAGTLQLGDGTTDGSIAASSSIKVDGALIFNLAGTHLYANPISGADTGTLTKTGAGTLTLAGANTFTGAFTLEQGRLNLNNATALGAAPGVFTITGGSLDNTSGAAITSASTKPQAWNADFTFAGTGDLAMGTGRVNIGGNAGDTRTVTVSAGTLGTGPINTNNIAINFTKAGSGALRFSGGSPVVNGIVTVAAGTLGTAEDFFADGLAGPGIFENGTANTKWSFWNIVTSQTTETQIRNGGGAGLLGLIKRGAGTWTLTNNANNATANLAVDLGTLALNNTGSYGVVLANSTVAVLNPGIGNTAAANGLLQINGASVNYNCASNADALAYRGTLNIANNATGAGAVHLNSGSLTSYRQLAIGSVAGASGGYRQTGGTTTVGGFLAIGLGTATGVLNQSGGTFTMSTSPVTNGAGTGSNGLMNLSGTAVFNQNGTADNGIWVGESGTGELNLSGTAALNFAATNNGLQLGRNATGVGTANLLGGTLVTPRVAKGAGAGTLNFNGGTLAANLASTTFLTGLTNAYVHAGGGTVNNGGNAITIGQALIAPAGSGVSASGLTVSGAGYIHAPVVRITGDGTGATAVANLDASGNLTGITITNPGSGYTTPPAFALIGGGIGATGAITGTASLVTEAAGSMSFTGSAITTLGGVNTYRGNTTIATNSILSLAASGALQFAPAANGVSNKVTGAGTATFYGAFNIDLNGAAFADGNRWTLVDAANRNYDPFTFSVTGFTQNNDVWTLVDGVKTWTFTEATGVLSLQLSGSVGYAGWAAANAGGGAAGADFDRDGVSNGVEYFMGATGSSFTANPQVVNGKISWPKSPSYTGTYTVQTSDNLVTWTNVPSTEVGGNVEYTLPAGSGKVFVRLLVTPN